MTVGTADYCHALCGMYTQCGGHSMPHLMTVTFLNITQEIPPSF